MSSTSDEEHVSGAEDIEQTAENLSNVTGDYLKKSDVLAALQVDDFEVCVVFVKCENKTYDEDI